MSKLLKLLEWVTVPQAAKHPSAIVGEEICEADVLRLALDQRIVLSVNFVNHARARRGKIIPFGEAETAAGIPVPGVEPYEVVLGLVLPDRDRVLVFDEEVVSISGVWDLAMIGSESLDVEHRYQALTDGPSVTLVGINGTFVQSGECDMCQLQEHFEDNEYVPKDRLMKPWSNRANFYPAGGLPKDAVFVVRTAELARFQAELSEADDTQRKATAQLDRRAETTYLTIIGALLELARNPGPGRDSDAAVIRELIENYGGDRPGISKTTLEAKFADARRRLHST